MKLTNGLICAALFASSALLATADDDKHEWDALDILEELDEFDATKDDRIDEIRNLFEWELDEDLDEFELKTGGINGGMKTEVELEVDHLKLKFKHFHNMEKVDDLLDEYQKKYEEWKLTQQGKGELGDLDGLLGDALDHINDFKPKIEGFKKFGTRFLRIVEYIDILESDGEGFVKDVDQVVSTYQIGSQGWLDLAEPVVDDSGLHTLKISTADGIFAVDMKFADKFVTLEGGAVNLPADTIKFDVIIDKYPYVREDSKLALEVRLDRPKLAARALGKAKGLGEKITKLIAFDKLAQFSWSDVAVSADATLSVNQDGVDGEVAVIATLPTIMDQDQIDAIKQQLLDNAEELEDKYKEILDKIGDLDFDEIAERMFFAFNVTGHGVGAGGKIVWDPMTSMPDADSVSTNGANMFTFSVAAVFVAVFNVLYNF